MDVEFRIEDVDERVAQLEKSVQQMAERIAKLQFELGELKRESSGETERVDKSVKALSMAKLFGALDRITRLEKGYLPNADRLGALELKFNRLFNWVDHLQAELRGRLK